MRLRPFASVHSVASRHDGGAEFGRVGRDAAWPSTKAAIKAVLASMAIELAAGLAATLVWVAGVVAT